MSPVDDQVEAVTSTVAIADTIATTPINTESQTSSIVLPASTSTTTAMVANDSQISTNTPSIGIMAIPHEFSDLQCRQLEELASLHKLSDSDLEGYITSNETATGQLSVVQLLRLLSAGYDRARQSVDEKQHELVTLHAEFARQQERLWQLDRSVTLLQRQVVTRRQQMNRSLSEQQELAVQSISTEQSQLQREIDSHPIPQIKVKPVRHKTSLKQVEETEDDIDPLNGHIESSLCSEDDELDRLPFDDVDMNEASHQHHKSRNIESRDRSSHLDRSQLDQDSFLNSYKRWRPRRGRRHSSLHRNALRRDSGPRSFAEEYDSDLDAEDTMWFSCGSPASSGDEQVPIGSMTKSSMETGSSIGGISLTGSLSSGALPRKSYFTSDNGTTRRPIALSSIGRPYSMTATSSGDHSQDRFNKGYMQKGKSPALLDEAAEADRQATVISPRARSSLEKWTAGLLTWRMSSAPSIARESDLNSQQQQETAAINNQHASKHLPTTSASTEHSLPISVNAETLKSRFLQEPLLSTLKEEHALKNSIAVAPTAVKTAIAAPSRSRSPVSGHFSISQSLSASPQSTSTSILSTAVAAAAQQLAISGRLNLSAKSTATTQEQRPHSIISTVSNDHRDSTLTAISSYDTESIFTDATSATNTHNTSAPGVPLHFKAIAIAAKLISGGQLNSTDIYSNSKRGIARWTVGLLAHQPFSIFNEEPPSSSSRKTSSASVTMKAAVAASAAATNNTDSKYYAKTLNSETNTENTTSSSDTIDMLQSRSSAHSSHKNSSRRRTPPTALPLMSSGSTTLASTELSGLSPATTSFTSAHAITTAMNTVPSGSVSGNGGNSSSSSICNSIELPLSSPPHSPTVATVRASSSGTVVTLRGQASTSSAGQHVLHSSKSGAARGLLAQLAEQHDTIQDAIMERWSKFAHAPEPASPLSAPASLHVTTSSASIASPLNEELNKPSKEDKVDIKIEEPVEEYDYINCLNKSRAKHSYLDSQQSTADTNREHNTDHSNKTADIVDNDATIRVKGSMTSALFASMPTTPIQHIVMENLPEGILARRIRNMSKKERKPLRQLVRAGVPAQLRPQIWLECSGAYDIRQPNYYRHLLDNYVGQTSNCMNQIEMDVHRTMPDNIFFGGDGPGVCKLRRVLTAYSWHNPTIGYCQGMNVMAATLLLVFPTSEENAFWTLVYLLEHIIPDGYHTHQLMAAQADQRVLEELCRDSSPQLAGHLKACGVDMAAVTISWFLSIFAESMPLETLLRVWDMVLVEGFLALFRISVALLHLHERDMLKLHSTAALYACLKGAPARTRRPERLLQLAFGRLRSVVRDEVVKTRRAHHTQVLCEEYACMSLP